MKGPHSDRFHASFVRAIGSRDTTQGARGTTRGTRGAPARRRDPRRATPRQPGRQGSRPGRPRGSSPSPAGSHSRSDGVAGRPAGRPAAFDPRAQSRSCPNISADVFLKPAQQARYLIGLAAAVLLAGGDLGPRPQAAATGAPHDGALVLGQPRAQGRRSSSPACGRSALWRLGRSTPSPRARIPRVHPAVLHVATLLAAVALAAAAALAVSNGASRASRTRSAEQPQRRRVTAVGWRSPCSQR